MGWKQIVATSLLSRDFVRGIKRERTLLWWRFLCFTPSNLMKLIRYRKATGLKVNIGAGKHQLNGWVNIDLSASTGFRWDVRWGLPLKTASVSAIHCEHFLEHLDYPHDADRFLRECRRVLVRGGEFRLIVPDAAKYIHAYSKKDSRYWQALQDLGGGPRPFETEIEIMNQAFRMGGDHHFAYDRVTLQKALQRAGFGEIETSDHAPDRFQDQSDKWRLVESLYLTVHA